MSGNSSAEIGKLANGKMKNETNLGASVNWSWVKPPHFFFFPFASPGKI
jgi:hypothetical protein